MQCCIGKCLMYLKAAPECDSSCLADCYNKLYCCFLYMCVSKNNITFHKVYTFKLFIMELA